MGLKDSNHIILYEGQNPRVNCAFNGIREVGEGDGGWCGSHSNTLPFHSLLLLIWLRDGIHAPGLSYSAPNPQIRRSKLLWGCSEHIHVDATLLRMSNIWLHDWASTVSLKVTRASADCSWTIANDLSNQRKLFLEIMGPRNLQIAPNESPNNI